MEGLPPVKSDEDKEDKEDKDLAEDVHMFFHKYPHEKGAVHPPKAWE